MLPDLALIPPGDYRCAHPTHALLIVEVAESSLRKDSSIKADLYVSLVSLSGVVMAISDFLAAT